MSLIKRVRKQWAVYWEPNGGVYQYGVQLYHPSEEIKVRWEDELVNVVDLGGREVVYQSMIYVGQDVKVDGVLFKGQLADLDDPSASPPTGDAKKIRRFEKMPDLRNKEQLRIAYL